MFSVFNTNLQTDMGKTIVRRHLASTDAQAVWKELSEHMKTSSKGASEKRRLTQYVTNTVLDDNFKGTTEQFVLHFNEQFRQLEEISEDDERLPSSVKLTLLQTAVRSINDLRIVETLDEFQSTTHGHGSSTSLSYDTYYDLLINACVSDRIPSTTPGAEPPRDARDSGSARSHSTHLETSSSDRPKWSPTRSSTRYQDQISVTCTRWTLRMPSFTRATHAQPSLSNFTRRDSNFGERTRSRGTTLGERNFPTSPKNKKTKLTHCSIYVPMRTISTSHAK